MRSVYLSVSSVLKDMALQQADNFRLHMLSAHGNVCVNKLQMQ